jgi:hypothetical protein
MISRVYVTRSSYTPAICQLSLTAAGTRTRSAQMSFSGHTRLSNFPVFLTIGNLNDGRIRFSDSCSSALQSPELEELSDSEPPEPEELSDSDFNSDVDSSEDATVSPPLLSLVRACVCVPSQRVRARVRAVCVSACLLCLPVLSRDQTNIFQDAAPSFSHIPPPLLCLSVGRVCVCVCVCVCVPSERGRGRVCAV